MGRPVSAYFESFVAAQTLDHFSEAGYQAMGTSSLNNNGYVNMTMRQPYGVVGAIIPWNVPVGFLINKSAPALMAGNTIVVKSSEKAPLTVSYSVPKDKRNYFHRTNHTPSLQKWLH